MNRIFRSTILVSFATFLSRILGFVRDILFSRILGGGVLMSAWSLSWQAPNLCRRILGEGALGAALIPILSETTEKQGSAAARHKFSTVMIWLFFLLSAITVLFSAAALIAENFAVAERWKLAFLTIPVIMPYCILICFIGVFTSVLNTFRIFFLPAIMNLLPNLFFIGTAFFFLPELMDTPVQALRAISVAMLISGVIEVLILAMVLKRNQMLPEISKSALLNFSAIREVWRKVLPGLIGASVLQIGSLIDSLIAMGVNDYAKSAMYYSDRLVDLPIGLFGVAFGTVTLPTLSKYVAVGKMKTMLISTFSSVRQLLFITIPMAVLMVLFARELLAVLFLGGKFDVTALNESYKALFWYAYGIPFFCMIKVVLNAFYSRQDMKTPAIVSLICICVNIVLSLILRIPMAQGGIALATVISSALNNIILIWILWKRFNRIPLLGTIKFTGIIFMISGFAGLAGYYSFDWMRLHPEYDFLPRGLFPLGCAAGIFAIVFILFSYFFQIHELRVVVKQVAQKLKLKK